MLPLPPSIMMTVASLVRINMTSSAEFNRIFVSEYFGLFSRLQLFVYSNQVIDMTGELELDTESVKKRTDNELMSSTAT